MSRECLEAFKRTDCEADAYLIKGSVATEGVVKFDYSKFLEKLLEFVPDILFLLNVNGLDIYGAIACICREKNINIACWFIDNPFYSFGIWRKLCDGRNAHFFVWDKYYIRQMQQYHGIVHHLPQATNPERFMPQDLAKHEQERFGSDIAFVGNLGTGYIVQISEQFKRNYSKDLEGTDVLAWFLRAAKISLERQIVEPALLFQTINSEYPQDKLDLKDELKLFDAQNILEANISSIIRMAIVKKLLPYRINVWGTTEWKECIPNELYKGPAVYMRDMPKIYNATKINLDISRFQQRKGTNQRIFDVPACEAFLITDYKQEIEELFDIDEMVFYRTIEDLTKQIEFYKNKPDLRKMIAKRGRKRILERHTYVHRMGQILDSVPCDREGDSTVTGTTSKKETQAWIDFFNGYVQKEKGDNKSCIEYFKKAISNSQKLKKIVDRELSKLQ
jgi:spore maturation protein CgeB